MARKRWKRKSGYFTPQPTISFKEIIREGFFINPVYGDWVDYRDGARDWYRDFKTIKKIGSKNEHRYDESVWKRIKMNLKQKRLILRRKARKMVKKQSKV